MRGGGSSFFVENFLSHSAEKLCRGTLLCCVSESSQLRISLWIRRGGSIKIFPRNFFVSRCRKTLQGNPSVLCFRKFLVAKKFMDNREGEVSRFSFGNFLSHGAEKLCRGTLLCCVSESFQLRIILWIRRGSIKIFRRNFFVSRCRKTLQGNSSVLCSRKVPVAKKKIRMRGGGSWFFVENFLSHSAEKFRR